MVRNSTHTPAASFAGGERREARGDSVSQTIPYAAQGRVLEGLLTRAAGSMSAFAVMDSLAQCVMALRLYPGRRFLLHQHNKVSKAMSMPQRKLPLRQHKT